MNTPDSRRSSLSGSAIAVSGNDIDTDRIIPARFLKSVTFDGLGEHAFADDRAQRREAGGLHPFDHPAHARATILLVNKNFGCGSSREHAPQALARWGEGISAIVGESFAEIFFGNCVALGMPCVQVSSEQIKALMSAARQYPEEVLEVDLERMRVRAINVDAPCTMPPGARKQLLEGNWDSTSELLAGKDQIAEVAQRLPYFESTGA